MRSGKDFTVRGKGGLFAWGAGVGFFLVAVIFWLLPLPRVPEHYSQEILDRHGHWLRVFLTPEETWRLWVPLDSLPPLLVQATLCYEDRRFPYHPGVDPLAVLRALWQNLRAGRVVSGASTLPMQVIRILNPRPRTLPSKILEALQALKLTAVWGKRKILEVYFNTAPYGGNIQGIRAAAWMYFEKPLNRLDPAETAFLVSLPQQPTFRFPRLSREKALRRARDRVLRRMLRCGLISQEDYNRALDRPVPVDFRPFPRKALHFTDWIHGRFPQRVIHTTLDPGIQEMVERLVAQEKVRVREMGARHLAAVVVENATGAVRAAVGSADYGDPEGGQIPGFAVPRPVGSLLKPFLAAVAFAEGVVTPRSVLLDVPIRFGRFAPLNYDHAYTGWIPLAEALRESRNVPFVDLLRKVGWGTWIRWLEDAGFPSSRTTPYGLSVITGGLEASLLEMVELYAMLARGGQRVEIRVREDEPVRSQRVLPEGAVVLVLRILRERERPDFPGQRSLKPVPVIYWKTGTAWGRTDAWSVGFTDRYTVGVWVGNFTPKPTEYLSGSGAAAPLMFDLLEALGGDSLSTSSLDLMPVVVCGHTGYPVRTVCPVRETVEVLGDRVPPPCPYHRAVWLVLPDSVVACGRTEGRVIRGVSLDAPPAVRQFLPDLPPAYPPCEEKGNLVVESPAEGVYVRSLQRRKGVLLLARTPAPPVFWYLNGRPLGESGSGEGRWVDLDPGRYWLSVLDRAGNRRVLRFEILP